jgi:quercetin dioxygenase-like cupin family protein
MADETREVVSGDGYAVGHLDAIGEGYGFRKIRRQLAVEAFGMNALVLPAGYTTPRHYHDEQEETYFVHAGRVEIEFGDGRSFVLGPGGLARVDASTVRCLHALEGEDAVVVIAGGKGGYVGRDGRLPDGETLSGDGPPGA